MKIVMRFASVFVCLLLLAGCNPEDGGDAHQVGALESVGFAAPAHKMARADVSQVKAPPSNMALDRAQFNDRRIAETHSLEVETEPDDLKLRYDRDFQKCLSLGCEIINSNVQSRQSAFINARIAPEMLAEYLDFLGSGVGELKSHGVRADDKTLQYIDTDAKIKNLEALKARLVKLLDSPKAENINQILQIERELNRVEQQLDSAKGALRHLQTITGKATVNARYSAPYRDIEIQYYDLKNSFKRAWQNFIRSIAEVIEYVGGIVPWIPVWFIGLWVFVKLVRFAFGKVRLPFLKKKTVVEPVKKAKAKKA